MSQAGFSGDVRGVVFDIQRFSIHDGPGIRTTVFLKGCPLRCLWCHNPESQSKRPELYFERDLCISCGNCVKACPNDAQAIVDTRRVIDRSSCAGTGDCVESCYTNALVRKGTQMTAAEVLDEVSRDNALYTRSGGGITLSGGEPASQPGFAVEILRGAQRSGLHTAIETCGFARWDVLAEILEVTDLIMYDIKHMNTDRHRDAVGTGNELILSNLERIAGMQKDIVVRVPLIPGINDGNSDLVDLANFLTGIGMGELELIPYHEFAATKYEFIDAEYSLGDLQAYTPERLAAKRDVLGERGITATIGI